MHRHARGIRRCRLVALVAAFSCGWPVAAATLDEWLAAAEASVPADELAEVGNPARAKALVGIDPTGLSPTEAIALRLAQAEAWIDARDAAAVAQTLAGLPRTLSDAQRERADLVRVAAWQLFRQQGQQQGEYAGDLLALVAGGSHRVRARALAVRAQEAMAGSGAEALAARVTALADLDQALVLLQDEPADDRLPLIRLRITAMEATGADPAQVDAWLESRKADPAVAGMQAERTVASAGSSTPAALPPMPDPNEPP